jgi:hypothetical protein
MSEFQGPKKNVFFFPYSCSVKNLTQVKGGAGVYGERHCDVHVALIVTPASDLINNYLTFEMG